MARPPDQPIAANKSKKNMRPNMIPTSFVTYMPGGSVHSSEFEIEIEIEFGVSIFEFRRERKQKK